MSYRELLSCKQYEYYSYMKLIQENNHFRKINCYGVVEYYKIDARLVGL